MSDEGLSAPPGLSELAADLLEPDHPSLLPVGSSAEGSARGEPMPSAAPPSEPVRARVGAYELVARYAGSLMSEVFLAHKSSEFGFLRRAVVKRANPTSAEYEACREMLLDEAKALAWLDHPNIVSVLDVGEERSGFYVAIEHVDGTDLRHVNALLRKRGEALPFELACFMAAEVLRGLHHAHTALDPEGRLLEIVHRDVNPSNVLISYTGHVKLTDFGVVRMRDRLQDKTLPGIVKGKFAYLAPEYILGKMCDLRVDIYGVGIMLLEMLTGRSCFSALSAHEVMRKIVDRDLPLRRLEREAVPLDLRKIVERAVEGDPAHRFGSAEEMANALETWNSRASAQASPWILSAFFTQHGLFDRSPSAEAEISDADSVTTHRTATTAPEPRPATVSPVPPLTRRTIPALQTFSDPPASISNSPSSDAPKAVPMSGELEKRPARDVLLELAEARASGTLEFVSGRVWKRVALIEGRPADISSNVGMEGLGEQLIRARRLSRADLDRAMREVGKGGQTFLDQIVDRGSVPPAALSEELGRNIEERLADVLEWRAGTFSFQPGHPPRPRVMPEMDLVAYVRGRVLDPDDSPTPAPAVETVPAAGRPSLTDALQMARRVARGAGRRVDTLNSGDD